MLQRNDASISSDANDLSNDGLRTRGARIATSDDDVSLDPANVVSGLDQFDGGSASAGRHLYGANDLDHGTGFYGSVGLDQTASALDILASGAALGSERSGGAPSVSRPSDPDAPLQALFEGQQGSHAHLVPASSAPLPQLRPSLGLLSPLEDSPQNDSGTLVMAPGDRYIHVGPSAGMQWLRSVSCPGHTHQEDAKLNTSGSSRRCPLPSALSDRTRGPQRHVSSQTGRKHLFSADAIPFVLLSYTLRPPPQQTKDAETD